MLSFDAIIGAFHDEWAPRGVTLFHGGAPSMPPTPDPYKTSAAQQVANVEVSKTNIHMGNADEVSPSGSITYTGSGKFIDIHTHDADGNVVTTQQVEKPLRTITLTTKGQIAWSKQEDIIVALNTWALSHLGYIQNLPQVGTDGLTARLAPPSAAAISTTAITPGSVVETIGSTNLVTHLGTVRDAIDARLQWQINVDRAARIEALDAQGIFAGSEAFDREMLTFDRASTDSRSQAYLMAGQEQTRIVQLDGIVGEFANRAQQIKFDLARMSAEWSRSSELTKFKAAVDAGEYINSFRERELQERIAVTGQAFNVLSALRSGGQVQIPQFQAYKTAQMPETPVMDAVYRSSAMDMQKYQIQAQHQQSLFGGLLGLGGNMLGMMMFSDRRLKRDIVRVADDARGFSWYVWRYVWDRPGTRHFGVMAQEVRRVMPGAVAEVGGFLAVDYGRLVQG